VIGIERSWLSQQKVSSIRVNGKELGHDKTEMKNLIYASLDLTEYGYDKN